MSKLLSLQGRVERLVGYVGTYLADNPLKENEKSYLYKVLGNIKYAKPCKISSTLYDLSATIDEAVEEGDISEEALKSLEQQYEELKRACTYEQMRLYCLYKNISQQCSEFLHATQECEERDEELTRDELSSAENTILNDRHAQEVAMLAPVRDTVRNLKLQVDEQLSRGIGNLDAQEEGKVTEIGKSLASSLKEVGENIDDPKRSLIGKLFQFIWEKVLGQEPDVGSKVQHAAQKFTLFVNITSKEEIADKQKTLGASLN